MCCINALHSLFLVYEDRFYPKVAKTAKAETAAQFWAWGYVFTADYADDRELFLYPNGLNQFEISGHQLVRRSSLSWSEGGCSSVARKSFFGSASVVIRDIRGKKLSLRPLRSSWKKSDFTRAASTGSGL
jgi:hypothetical protein